MLWIILVGIIIFVLAMVDASEREKKKDIKSRRELVKKEASHMISNSFIKELNEALTKRVSLSIKWDIERFVERNKCKPESIEEFLIRDYFKVCSWGVIIGDAKFCYKDIGYVDLKEHQDMVVCYALCKYSKKWTLKYSESSKYYDDRCFYLNEEYWKPYIQKEIDSICVNKGIKPLNLKQI